MNESSIDDQKEKIRQLVKEENVKFINLQFTDIFGKLKNVAITTSQLESALNNEVMFDGSSIKGFVRVEESDMVLHPDPNTFEIFPWRTDSKGKAARMLCDVYNTDGTQFEGCPRGVLKKVLKELKSYSLLDLVITSMFHGFSIGLIIYLILFI